MQALFRSIDTLGELDENQRRALLDRAEPILVHNMLHLRQLISPMAKLLSEIDGRLHNLPDEQTSTPTSPAMPLVSIVVPIYNHEQFVGATIRSLIAQTYRNLELILVNDGSNDRSGEVVAALAEECRARFVRFVVLEQANAGTAAALNRGIAASQGQFLFWIASDDLAEPAAIATLLPELERDPGVGLACGDADFIDAEGKPITQKRDGNEFTSFVRFYSSRNQGLRSEDRFRLLSLIDRPVLRPDRLPCSPLAFSRSRLFRHQLHDRGHRALVEAGEDLPLRIRRPRTLPLPAARREYSPETKRSNEATTAFA